MNTKDSEFIVRRIRAGYVEKETTELDELKALDTKVKRPANIFAYIFGTVAALILGFGMSLITTDVADVLGIGEPIFIGTVIGVIGLLLTLLTYPIYSKMLASRKARYSQEILDLSDKIINN